MTVRTWGFSKKAAECTQRVIKKAQVTLFTGIKWKAYQFLPGFFQSSSAGIKSDLKRYKQLLATLSH